MTSRPGFLTIGCLAAVGLGVMAWNDPTSLLHRGIATWHDSSETETAAVRPAIQPAPPLATTGTAAPRPTEREATARAGRTVTLGNPLADVQADQFRAMTERPLFTPGRRPPQPKRVVVRPKPATIVRKPAPPPAPRKPTVGLSLVGTVSDKSGKVVILKDQRTGRYISSRIDAEVQGWRVTDIQSSSVLLKKDQWSVRLEIFKK